MMKKITSVLFALLLSTSAFSTTAINSQYGSTQHPLQTKNLLHPPTDITVVNASGSYFYAIVPNSPISDYITPGTNDHIYNYNPNIYTTWVVLNDVYGNTFYSNNVCREAIITVAGYTGNFRINTDTDLCN
jgi:hypothetical protein